MSLRLPLLGLRMAQFTADVVPALVEPVPLFRPYHVIEER